MNRTKLKIGLATAVTGVSLLTGGVLLGVPWASAQTPPPQPTPQQGTPAPQGTPRGDATPRQGGPQQPGQQGDHDCPKDENGQMQRHGGPGGQGQQNSGTPGGTSFGGARTLRQ
jgi:hypothetical protein